MKTILTNSADKAAEIIKAGGLAAFPTETVYGLGADVFNETALEKIFEAKGRPADNPLIVHIGKIEQLELLVREVTADAARFIENFFPGPLTLVLPKASQVPLLVTAGLDTIGVRMPGNELALEFLKLCDTPVAAPSANLSGRPSPTTWQAVYEDLEGKIDCILQSDATEVGLESTVVDCTGEVPIILRSGAVTLEQLQMVIPETRFVELASNDAPKSPGLKHKHYAPKAKVILVDEVSDAATGFNCAYIGLRSHLEEVDIGLACYCGSVSQYSHNLFEFFRLCDRSGIEIISCEKVPAKGLGLALMDRLERAAQS